jgi:hypothetical protein
MWVAIDIIDIYIISTYTTYIIVDERKKIYEKDTKNKK